MRIHDLTHPISQVMPVFPGTEPPEIHTVCTVAEHGFLERKIALYSHTGTHIDAPAHMVADGSTLDAFPIEKFIGKACIYRHSVDGRYITPGHLQHLAAQLASADFLLIATGWDQYWGREEYFGDFPVLATESARWLLQFPLNGVGFDVISADAMTSRDFLNHQILLGHDLVLVENLTGLMALPSTTCTFQCLPLYFQNGDGSPVRAVAWND